MLEEEEEWETVLGSKFPNRIFSYSGKWCLTMNQKVRDACRKTISLLYSKNCIYHEKFHPPSVTLQFISLPDWDEDFSLAACTTFRNRWNILWTSFSFLIILPQVPLCLLTLQLPWFSSICFIALTNWLQDLSDTGAQMLWKHSQSTKPSIDEWINEWTRYNKMKHWHSLHVLLQLPRPFVSTSIPVTVLWWT